MRILHVNKFLYRRGGAEAYALDLADAQRAAGHEVGFFAMDHPENQPDAHQPWFPDRIELDPMPSTVRGRVAGVGRMVWSVQSWRGVQEVVHRFRPDVAHLHNVYHQLSPSVVRGLTAAGVPVVMTLHDYKLICPSYQLLADGQVCERCVTGGPLQAIPVRCKGGSFAATAVLAGESWIHRRTGAWDGVDLFVSPSRFLASRVVAGGMAPDRVVVVPHPAVGLMDPSTPADEPQHATTPGRPIVVAGRLAPEKGVDIAIAAVAGSADRVRLEIAGDGPERARLERLAATTAPGRVQFHGRLDRPDLHRLIRSAAAVAVPSVWHENQPMSILEAFALGRPVIATSLGGAPELVVDGLTGWLAPPQDPRALAAAMTDAVDRPDEADRRGASAGAFVVEHHAVDRHLAALDEVYAIASDRRRTAGIRRGSPVSAAR